VNECAEEIEVGMRVVMLYFQIVVSIPYLHDGNTQEYLFQDGVYGFTS